MIPHGRSAGTNPDAPGRSSPSAATGPSPGRAHLVAASPIGVLAPSLLDFITIICVQSELGRERHATDFPGARLGSDPFP